MKSQHLVMRASLLAVRAEYAAGDLAEELLEHGGDGVHGERVDVDEAALRKARHIEINEGISSGELSGWDMCLWHHFTQKSKPLKIH